MRVSSRGRVKIPVAIREEFGLVPNTRVEFVVRGGEVVLQAAGIRRDDADRLVESMRGAAKGGLSTDEIMRLTREYDRD
ncbi:MAG TPA: AbrB/MazE/SpoVT family DNA-binding domain-containing protein [Terrimesophilobacter sp.]|nr:AbrB/MazE/SpoVT family DNA-binding domain-containing protein [Terrimesophilobacter sp.]